MENDINELKAEIRALAAIWHRDWNGFDGRTLQHQVERIIKNIEAGEDVDHYRKELKESEDE